MKLFAHLRHLVWFVVVLVCAGGRAEAQTIPFAVTSSLSSLLVSNQVTFSIDLTNLTGFSIANLVVTDSLSAPVIDTSFNPDVTTPIQIGENLVTFNLLQFIPGQILQITLSTVPTQPGLLTNTVTITTPSLLGAGETNVIVNVTNTIILANLGVTLTPPAQASIVGDYVSYGLTVTNGGPDTAPGVMLTNTLPPGVILEGVTPASQTYTTISSNLIFNLGAIGPGNITSLQVTVEPTNGGVLPFSAAVGSASVTNVSDLITATNSFLSVSNIETGVLAVGTNSGQAVDFQNGLEEQTILVANTNSAYTNVTAVRVVVAGLTKQLYNAVGTNGGNPYVTYTAPAGQPLLPGQSVSLRLQYSPRGSFSFSKRQLLAYPVPPPDLTPPATTNASGKINISGIFKLADGNMLLEFPATTGRTYTVVYSDNVQFSNAMTAPPAIPATANILQWIDYGPPTTVSAPTNSGVRFYRVIQNP